MPVYLVTQYGQLYGVFTLKGYVKRWAHTNIPQHLWSEYRVHMMEPDETFVPGADNQTGLKQFMET